jgi:hypothetical protein
MSYLHITNLKSTHAVNQEECSLDSVSNAIWYNANMAVAILLRNGESVDEAS